MAKPRKKVVALRDCTAEELIRAINGQMRQVGKSRRAYPNSPDYINQYWALFKAADKAKELAAKRMAKEEQE